MEVTCTFKHQSFSFKDGNNQNEAGYTCLVRKIVFLTNSQGIKIIGEHADEMKCDRDVVGLMIDNCPELDKFPRGFGLIFRNLIYVQIRRCSLTVLSSADFIDLPYLRGLWLPENYIVALKKDLFADVQGLQRLCFLKNKLKYISKDVLAPLKNLKAANFEQNTCIDYNYRGEEGGLEILIKEFEKCIQSPPSASTNGKDLNNNDKRIEALESTVKLQARKIANLEARLKRLEEISAQ